MTADSTIYHPISCEFHDMLEALATRQRRVLIRFHDAEGHDHQRHTTIADVFSRDGAEYLLLGTRENVRLDRLVEADGISSSNYCARDED